MSQDEQQKDLAYAALLLERQFESYQRLHEEELAAIRAALAELKRRILNITLPAEANEAKPLETSEEAGREKKR